MAEVNVLFKIILKLPFAYVNIVDEILSQHIHGYDEG